MQVGYTEEQAKEDAAAKGYELGKSVGHFRANSKALAEGEGDGIAKYNVIAQWQSTSSAYSTQHLARVSLDVKVCHKRRSWPAQRARQLQLAVQTVAALSVLFNKSTEEIVGVHIIGLHAADLIQECSNAVATGTTVRELSMLVHTHPTLCEVLDEAFKAQAAAAVAAAVVAAAAAITLAQRHASHSLASVALPFVQIERLRQRLLRVQFIVSSRKHNRVCACSDCNWSHATAFPSSYTYAYMNLSYTTLYTMLSATQQSPLPLVFCTAAAVTTTVTATATAATSASEGVS
eukprot:18055-Heterococcus_DN1.PRE.2